MLVHGWGDTSETWQFVVDHLSPARTLVAMDMRGFGRTQRPDDGYWFPDYLADLDALLDHLSPGAPLDLVGHSMGGNIVMLYAGARPQRVRKVASLEAFGLPRTNSEQAPARYAEWLDAVKFGNSFATYDTYEFHAGALSQPAHAAGPAGIRRPLVGARGRGWPHRAVGGSEAQARQPGAVSARPGRACWRAIVAPLLLVLAEESELTKRMAGELGEDHLHSLFANLTTATIRGAGHMIHHERPEETAALLENFAYNQYENKLLANSLKRSIHGR